MTTQQHILIVDDAAIVREALSAYLEREGYAVRTAENGLAMRALLADAPADLVIVDLKLKGEDGFVLTRYLRENHGCGIIMLTSKADVTDRIVALEIGADDYVCKPYDARELLARIRSVLRRSAAGPAPAAPQAAPHAADATVRMDSWAFDAGARRVVGPDGRYADLTGSEYNLVSEFVRKPGRVLGREHLLQVVYDRPWDYYDRSIDVLVTRLRRKLEGAGIGADVIRSVRGVGYTLTRTGPLRPAEAQPDLAVA